MNPLRRLFPLLFLLVVSDAQASPTEAQAVRKSYQLATDKWALEMRIATTPEERAKVWAARPDTASFARQMWDAIGSSLDQDWTLESAAWFLRTTASALPPPTPPGPSRPPSPRKTTPSARRSRPIT